MTATSWGDSRECFESGRGGVHRINTVAHCSMTWQGESRNQYEVGPCRATC